MRPTQSNKLPSSQDRKSTRLNSSHTEIYTLSLHDALPISRESGHLIEAGSRQAPRERLRWRDAPDPIEQVAVVARSEEHTSELQSHRDLHSFPTRRSSDLARVGTPDRGRVPPGPPRTVAVARCARPNRTSCRRR